MMKRITAAIPYEAYWKSNSRGGYIYEILSTTKQEVNPTKDYISSVLVLNMRTGKEKVLRPEDFKDMIRLPRNEAKEIYCAKYGSRRAFREMTCSYEEKQYIQEKTKLVHQFIRDTKKIENAVNDVLAITRKFTKRYRGI